MTLLDGMSRLIQFFVNLVLVILLAYGVNRYVYSIVFNIEKNLNNKNIVSEYLHKLPNQMYLLFIFGIVVSLTIFIIHYFLNCYFKKKN